MRGAIVLAKRRTVAEIAALDRLALPQVDPRVAGILVSPARRGARLRPVCQVSYHRMARLITVNGDHGPADARFRIFTRAHCATSGSCVPLERRSRMAARSWSSSSSVPAPMIFRTLVEQFALSPQTASKSRLGLAATAAEASTVDGLRA